MENRLWVSQKNPNKGNLHFYPQKQKTASVSTERFSVRMHNIKGLVCSDRTAEAQSAGRGEATTVRIRYRREWRGVGLWPFSAVPDQLGT